MPEALPEPAICRAGCAQKVITPPTGVSLAGYFHDRIGETVRDDLFARAVVIEANGERAAHTFVVELANERASTYVPTTNQAERGAYGAKPGLSRWLCADAGRRMADAAQVMLWRLWD